MNTIYLDIETIPNQSPEYRAEVRKNITAPAQYKKQDSIDKWIAENGEAAADEAISKTSFDPAYGHVCTIGYAMDEGEPIARHIIAIEEEAEMIECFFSELPDLGVNQFVGHYISGFDLSFILRRSIILGVKLPPKVAFPRHPKPWDDCVFDTMVAWAGPRDRISQDNLCKALGLPSKGDFDGSMVAEAWANGQHERIAEYCKRDVATVRQIHKRFEAVGY